jgi:hypothetical protein
VTLNFNLDLITSSETGVILGLKSEKALILMSLMSEHHWGYLQKN